MKSFVYLSIILLFVSGCGGGGGGETVETASTPATSTTPSVTEAVARTQTLKAVASVDTVRVASSYFSFKSDAPENEALVPYLQGTLDGKYITDVINGSEISFDVVVPDDATTYGEAAGKTIKYVGIVFYPTQLDANYTNPQSVSSWDVPSIYTQMEKTIDTVPLFLESSTKYPLVLYSHGRGGDAITTGRIMSHLASNGYIVLGLFHGDRRFNLYGGDVYAPEEATLRPLAMKQALDFLQTSKYKANIDFDNIGAFGNSYGGSTSFMLVGGKPINVKSSVGAVLTNTVSDARIKVAVGVEPAMGDNTFPTVAGSLVTFFGFGSSGASTVNRPYLAITGTSDTVAVEKYTQAVVAKTPKDAHLVSMEGESHEMTPEGIVTTEVWTLSFLNYYLKGDDAFLSMKDVEGLPVDTYSSPY